MDPKQAKEAWVTTLSETMPLAALDYTAPQNYIMKSFVFPFPSSLDSDRQSAVTHLKVRLERALSLLPFLAGQMIHARQGELPRLVYPGEGVSSNLELFPDEVFDHQVLDLSQFPWTFAQLSALGVPANTMIKDTLWLLPKTGPNPGDACHPVMLRASFIEGGLILGFSLHHGIMDGSGTVVFLNIFGSDAPSDASSTSTLKQRKQNFIAFSTNTAQTNLVDPRSMPGYDFTVPPFPPTFPRAIAKIFTISARTATTLHAAALAHVRAAHGPAAFASTSDVLCALAWLHVTRARLRAGRIAPGDTTRFSTAVSIRGILDASSVGVGAGYIGNLFLRALAGSTVRDLVGGDDDDGVSDEERGAATARIAGAAWRIRRAVTAMRDPAVVGAHLAIATRATDPAREEGPAWPEVDAAVRRAIARHTTGLDASVGVGLGADVEFEIPGVEGGRKTKAAWVRRAYVANDGAMNLLPRRGTTKGGEDWEIWLALREEDMRVLEEPGELGGWLCRPAA